MEPIAINKSKLYKEDFIEAAKYTMSKTFKLVLTVSGVSLLFCGVWMYQLKGDFAQSDFTPFFCTLLAVLLLALRFCYDRIFGRYSFRKEQVNTANTDFDYIECRVLFYKDYLRVGQKHGDTVEFPYSQLKKVQITENLMILFFAGRDTLFLRKDSFTMGSLEDVLSLWDK